MASVFNAFVAYQFLKTLTNRWDQMEAYKLGIIDANGKQLKKTADLETQKEKNAYTIFHRLVFNLKRILERFPFGKSRIASYSAAFALLKESKNDFSEEEYEMMESLLMEFINAHEEEIVDLNEELEYNESWYKDSANKVLSKTALKKQYDHAVKTLKSVIDRKKKQAGSKGLRHSIEYYAQQIARSYDYIDNRQLANLFRSEYPALAEEFVSEEIVNSVGTGANIAGLTGVPSKFAGMQVFPVKTDTYVNLFKGKKKFARWKKYMESDEAQPIRDYIKKKPKEKIVLMDQSTGTMMFLYRHNEI
jgi:hypothetical protein